MNIGDFLAEVERVRKVHGTPWGSRNVPQAQMQDMEAVCAKLTLDEVEELSNHCMPVWAFDCLVLRQLDHTVNSLKQQEQGQSP